MFDIFEIKNHFDALSRPETLRFRHILLKSKSIPKLIGILFRF